LETWYPDLPLQYPALPELAPDPAREPFVLVFPGSQRYYATGNLDSCDWRLMIQTLSKIAMPRMVGAYRDLDFIRKIYDLGQPPMGKYESLYGNHHLFNKPISEVLAAATSPHCRGIVGVDGGPIIVSVIHGCPGFLFYPPHLERMPGTWTTGDMKWNWGKLFNAPSLVANGTVAEFLEGA
jgi:hypothetical protein